MKKYSVLLQLDLKVEDKDKLDETVEIITRRITKILKKRVTPYGYYEHLLPTNQELGTKKK